jgi:hypothetical protein
MGYFGRIPCSPEQVKYSIHMGNSAIALLLKGLMLIVPVLLLRITTVFLAIRFVLGSAVNLVATDRVSKLGTTPE